MEREGGRERERDRERQRERQRERMENESLQMFRQVVNTRNIVTELIKCMGGRRLNIVKMTLYPNLIYRLNSIPFNIPTHYLVNIDKGD
jgi:hypothetical protein